MEKILPLIIGLATGGKLAGMTLQQWVAIIASLQTVEPEIEAIITKLNIKIPTLPIPEPAKGQSGYAADGSVTTVGG